MGSGFKPIKPREGDIAVVAGMGGTTIAKIIDESKEIADSFKKLILQPMQNQAKLREYLLTTGYQIIDENVAIEDNRFYEIIVAKKGIFKAFDEIDVLVGPVLRNKKTSVISEYINHRIEIIQKIIQRLKATDSKTGKAALEEHRKQMEALKEVIK